ncbi:hypothetical protein [Flammeovirga pacifica]|uniref:Uncharacterized protein n=1 Tax=Flammeovirga pacifica TaxID=915059 RepID=A0A1S1YTE6_FLAPC|nr:hypothetical protein [Flammeovirga pacifica]OHX64289.1 hypothetical protein NH26_22065 [Flammeovirga pacifica]
MLVERDIKSECQALILEGRPDEFIKQKILEVKKSALAAETLIKNTKKEFRKDIRTEIKSMLEDGKDIQTIKKALDKYPNDLYNDGVNTFLKQNGLKLKAEVKKRVLKGENYNNIIKQYSNDLYSENDLKKWVYNAIEMEIDRIKSLKNRDKLMGFFGVIGGIILLSLSVMAMSSGGRFRVRTTIGSIFLMIGGFYKLTEGFKDNIPTLPNFDFSEDNSKCELFR